MSIRIMHVRMSAGTTDTHEHITTYRWVNRETGQTGTSSKATMVDWIDVKHGRAVVETTQRTVEVGVVKPRSGEPYLRTHADGQWTDNLLALPRF